jgi:predicted TIM-barrel fold metal-dependent hydrolase
MGDADLRLPDADPAWLRPLLEDPATRDGDLVLLHCHPFVAEAAWLASVYPQVWIDLSLAVPLLGPDGSGLLRAALAHAPVSKVLLGTDAAILPERFWVAARALREAVGRALAGIEADGYLAGDEAPEVAAALLAGNARRLYRLDGWPAPRS